MNHKSSTMHWVFFALSLLALGCGSRARDDIRGGESHFLEGCESTCGGGLSCIDERCTRECTEQSDCSGLAADAVCAVSDNGATCNVASVAPCEEGGRNYALGDQWPCSDGCNTCYCTEDGVESTLVACVSTCEYEGTTYTAGDEWTCSDGCNTCTCSEDGTVTTTDVACAVDECTYNGETYAVGDEWTCSDGCNTCTCLEDGTVTTTDVACFTCTENGQEYQLGDVIELGGGTTCICVEPGLLGRCTGVVDDGGPGTAATVTEALDGGPALPNEGDRARCYLPPDSGDCLAAQPAIYFDASSGQCLQFIYGGCGGNANRFDNLGECYDACGGDAF